MSVRPNRQHTSIDLLRADETPDGAAYPTDYLTFLRESGITKLQPWYFVGGEELRDFQEIVIDSYPDHRRLLFAKRVDTDDTACWDLDTRDVVSVHVHASPGWEERGPRFPSFVHWLRDVMDEFILCGDMYEEEDSDPTRRLPEGRDYPVQLVTFVNTGVREYGKWRMITKDQPHADAERNDNDLLPFAIRTDGSAVACLQADDSVAIVDNATGETTSRFDDFADWLRAATDELVTMLAPMARPE
jgi:hypothetical protein